MQGGTADGGGECLPCVVKLRVGIGLCSIWSAALCSARFAEYQVCAEITARCLCSDFLHLLRRRMMESRRRVELWRSVFGLVENVA